MSKVHYPLYTFALNRIVMSHRIFLTHYFETSKWHQGISEIAVEGARNHGLLNVGIQDFF